MKKFISLLFVFIILSCSCGIHGNAEENAIWQDPNNVVLVWDNDEGNEYKIFRSDKQDGDYEYIGVSDHGSYRDDTVTYPNTYYYKIEKNDLPNPNLLRQLFHQRKFLL